MSISIVSSVPVPVSCHAEGASLRELIVSVIVSTLDENTPSDT